MRILLVNRHFGQSLVPTARMLADVAAELVSSGHQLTVITAGSTYVRSSESGPHPQGSNPKLIRVRALDDRYKVVNWVLFLMQAWWLVLFTRWDRCLLLTDPPFLVLCAIAAKRFGFVRRSVYWWTMDLYPEALVAEGIVNRGGIVERAMRWLNSVSLGYVDGAICLDNAQETRLRTYNGWADLPSGSRTVPPWDDRPIRRVLPEDNRFLRHYQLEGYRIALYAGNLGRAHSFSEIVDAAKDLRSAGRDDWRIVFVARGARRADLESAAKTLGNIIVLDYQPIEWTSDMLSAADVHLITMRPGWEGVVVPSKLYGIQQTRKPALFVGPEECGTAREIRHFNLGEVLPAEATGRDVVRALDALYSRQSTPQAASARHARAEAIAEFITEESQSLAANSVAAAEKEVSSEVGI